MYWPKTTLQLIGNQGLKQVHVTLPAWPPTDCLGCWGKLQGPSQSWWGASLLGPRSQSPMRLGNMLPVAHTGRRQEGACSWGWDPPGAPSWAGILSGQQVQGSRGLRPPLPAVSHTTQKYRSSSAPRSLGHLLPSFWGSCLYH